MTAAEQQRARPGGSDQPLGPQQAPAAASRADEQGDAGEGRGQLPGLHDVGDVAADLVVDRAELVGASRR